MSCNIHTFIIGGSLTLGLLAFVWLSHPETQGTSYTPAVASSYQTQTDGAGWPGASQPLEHLVNECARVRGIDPLQPVTAHQWRDTMHCIDVVRRALAAMK